MTARSEDNTTRRAHEDSIIQASSLGWKVFVGLTTALVTLLTNKVMDKAWRRLTGHQPPQDPLHTTWREAAGWAATSGVAIGLARVFATRRAAATWHKASGSPPPGLEPEA
jgi:hypothetical protein